MIICVLNLKKLRRRLRRRLKSLQKLHDVQTSPPTGKSWLHPCLGVGGRLAGWVVGNCDFNENPVVHLDLDFDLGFVSNYGLPMFTCNLFHKSKS